MCSLSQADLSEVYAVREGIEMVAMRHAIAAATDQNLKVLRSLLDSTEELWRSADDFVDAAASDLDFHRYIFKMTGNRRLLEMFEVMASQTMLLLRSASLADPTIKFAPDRNVHRELLDAIVTLDVNRAEKAVSEHYVYTEHRLFSGLEYFDGEALEGRR